LVPPLLYLVGFRRQDLFHNLLHSPRWGPPGGVNPESGTDPPRDRSRGGHKKEFPASTAHPWNPFFTPKKQVVCEGFAVRASSHP